MSFSFKCGHCDTKIQAEESWVGKQMSCPVCGQMVTIPPPGQEAALLTPAPTAMPATTTPVANASAVPVSLGLATIALIFGILSFIFVPFCGLIALILGIIALVKINKSNGMLLGKGKAITSILLGIWAFVRIPFLPILAAIFLPAMGQARERARDISCASNMKQIGLAILMFADDNNDKCPKANECKAKIMGFVGDEKCFHCPSSTSSADSYLFFVNGQKITDINNPSATIIAVCTSTHTNNQVNVLFADGHVASRDKNEVDAAIQRTSPSGMPMLK